MKRVYNSGKISGLPFSTVQNKFEQSDILIRRMGYKAINPLKNKLPNNAPWWLHMIFDIALLLTCRAIYLQSDWNESKGAKIEYKIAQFLKFKIIKQTT